MNEDYDIEVPIDTQELEEMLLEDKSFKWVFPTLQDKNVQITIKLFKEENFKLYSLTKESFLNTSL